MRWLQQGKSEDKTAIDNVLIISIHVISGLSQTSTSGGAGSSQETNQQLSDTVIIAIRMVQTAIGLAIGLFAAAACVYPFGKRGYLFAF